MIGQLRAELLKQRSTLTNVGLFSAMLGLVLLVVLLHGFGIPTQNLGRRAVQLEVLGQRGDILGTLFAALVGAMSITAEFRHGTIRPTFLATPRRGRVVAAKVEASMLIGTAFGLFAAAVAAGGGTAALALRGVEMKLDAGDYALMLAGGASAAALWAAIGVGLGAVVRNQVPTLVGICAWLLFVEGLLVGDLFGGRLGEIARFMPGALAKAASGQNPLLAPGPGLFLLALYAATAALAGWVATTRRDVM